MLGDDASDPPLPTVDALFRAHSHPLRSRILAALDDRVASPAELAGDLQEPLANVAYHTRVLASLKCVRLVRQQQKRGAMEHFYTSVVGELRAIPGAVLELHAAYVGRDLGLGDFASRCGLDEDVVADLFETYRLGLRSDDRRA